MPAKLGRLVRTVRGRGTGRSPTNDELARDLRRLEGRVERLEAELGARVQKLTAELQEQQRLNQRIASLSDFVAEVVSASARGDREGLDAALAKYADGL